MGTLYRYTEKAKANPGTTGSVNSRTWFPLLRTGSNTRFVTQEKERTGAQSLIAGIRVFFGSRHLFFRNAQAPVSEPLSSFFRLTPDKAVVRIVMIFGKPGCITGLDEGFFVRSTTWTTDSSMSCRQAGSKNCKTSKITLPVVDFSPLNHRYVPFSRKTMYAVD